MTSEDYVEAIADKLAQDPERALHERQAPQCAGGSMTDYPTFASGRWSHDFIEEVPKNARGQYVPVVAVADDTPSKISKDRAFSLGHDRCCATCGGPMGDLVWFVKSSKAKVPFRFGPNGRRHFHILEGVRVTRDENPPMHLACAKLTLHGGCPMLSSLPEHARIALGARDYDVIEDDSGVFFSATLVEARRIKRAPTTADRKRLVK